MVSRLLASNRPSPAPGTMATSATPGRWKGFLQCPVAIEKRRKKKRHLFVGWFVEFQVLKWNQGAPLGNWAAVSLSSRPWNRAQSVRRLVPHELMEAKDGLLIICEGKAGAASEMGKLPDGGTPPRNKHCTQTNLGGHVHLTSGIPFIHTGIFREVWGMVNSEENGNWKKHRTGRSWIDASS